MPLYEYECADCGERFARLRPMREATEPSRCPKCGSERGQRVLSGFTAVTSARCGPASGAG